MKFKIVAVIVMIFLLLACGKQTDENKDIDNNGGGGITKYMPSGQVHDGPCLSGGIVTIRTLYPEDLTQTSEVFVTNLLSNFGDYDASEVMQQTPYQYAEVSVEAYCYNEVAGYVMQEKKILKSLVDLAVSGVANINPLTTIIVSRIRQLYNDFGDQNFYQNFAASEIQASKELLENAFGIYGVTTLFRDMSLDNANGGPLLAMNAQLMYEKDVAQQMSMLQDLSNTLPLVNAGRLAELRTAAENLNPYLLKYNIENRYAELDVSFDAPDFWNYVDSNHDGTMDGQDPNDELKKDILSDSLKIIHSYNIDKWESGNQINDYDIYTYFAIPYIFDVTTDAKYIGAGIEGYSLSVYDNDESGDGMDSSNDKPGNNILTSTLNLMKQTDLYLTKFVDIEGKIYESLSYAQNGTIRYPSLFLGKIDYTFEPGKKYWIVSYKEISGSRYIMANCENQEMLYGKMARSSDGNEWTNVIECMNFFLLNE